MKNNSFSKMNVLFIFFIVFVIAELEIMINYPRQWIIILVLGCIIVIDACLIASSKSKEKKEYEEYEKKKEEMIHDIIKSDKATYLLLKKNFLDLDDRLLKQENANLSIINAIEVTERKLQKSMLQTMEEDKKVARIMIGRNKENAEAMMNSNDEVKEKLYGFEEKILEISDRVSLLSENESISKIDNAQYQQILDSVSDLERQLKEYINESMQDIKLQLEESLKNVTLQITNEEIVKPEPLIDLNPDSDFELESEVFEKPEEPVLMESELTVEPEMSIDDIVIEPETEPEIEESMAELAAESEIEEPMAELAAEVEESPMPDLSDPNKAMSPDDIAALLASINAEEPVIEAEPEPIKEEKPPMPDLSDPNKVMSPDDIAALLANM